MTVPEGTSATGLDARDPRLDGLRGAAILLVMLYHLTLFGNARGPAEVAFTLLPSIGWSGVDLFFVLSGFLITGILLRTKGGDGYFRSFYARRVLRIFPLYYAVLIFFLVFVQSIDALAGVNWFWLPGAEQEELWYWVYLSNVHVALTGRFHHYALGITWSLAIEEHFYLLWPLIVHWCSRRALIRVCVGILVGAFLLRCAFVGTETATLAIYVLTPFRIDTLATGALIALLLQDPLAARRLARAARLALPASALLIAGYVVSQRFGGHGGVAGAAGFAAATENALAFVGSPLLQTVGYSLFCILYGSLLVCVLGARPEGRVARGFSWAPLQSVGRYSYSMYLLHLVGGEFARAFVEPARFPDHFVLAHLAYWTVAIGLTWILAFGTWHLLEMHFLALKRHFPYPRPSASA